MLVAVLVLGCSHRDLSRPLTYNPVSDALDSRAPYIKDDARSRAERRMANLAQALAAWKAKSSDRATDYLIGPGDVLEVSVFALESPDTTTTLVRTVSEDGYVTLPWVQSTRASELTCRELEDTIKEAYAGRYIKDPQVTVTVRQYLSSPVVVTGAVNQPGVYYLTRNKSSILSMLAEAGGLTLEAGDTALLIRGSSSGTPAAKPEAGGTEGNPGPIELDSEPAAPDGTSAQGRNAVVIDLEELVDEGNLELNLEVGGGDILSVPPRQEEYVFVLGYVQKPGAYELKDSMKVDTLRAVALAGGLASAARAENSVLIRETPDGQRIIPVDLTKISRGVRPPLYMEAGDTLVIGSSFFGRLSEFVRPSIGAGMNLAP